MDSALITQQATITIEGTRPLLLHSLRGLNPSDPLTKSLAEVTSKRKKTDADHADIARMEWELGLYWDKTIGPYVPGQMLWRTIVGGARITRGGKEVERAILDLSGQDVPILYRGPRDLDAMYAAGMLDMRAVRVMNKRIMRTRPSFSAGWKLQVTFLFDPNIVDPGDLHRYTEAGGRFEGLGDGRNIGMGRFVVEKFATESVELVA